MSKKNAASLRCHGRGPRRPKPLKDTPKRHVARAEPALALPDHFALREVPIKPDPLEALAAAVADVREDLGERADIVMDLVPISPSRWAVGAAACSRALVATPAGCRRSRPSAAQSEAAAWASAAWCSWRARDRRA